MDEQQLAVGVLGATGTVGQRFIQLLESHPQFRISVIGASPRSAGKQYRDAVNWKLASPIPKNIAELTVQECKATHFVDCKIVFSGLDAQVAGEVEKEFQLANLNVFSNAKNHRMDVLSPLCVPLVNTQHLDLIPEQRKALDTRGFIVTNANCSTTGLVVPLKALSDKVGPLERVHVVTMQAISGSGYPGVASLDILDNVVPFISGEEEKMQNETSKILGYDLKVSATCNRVPVLDGHLMCVSVAFKSDVKPTTVSEVMSALEYYRCEGQDLKVHSAPDCCITLFDDNTPDRPQPRLDRDLQSGMCVSVGRVRECSLFDVKFTVLVHNTVLGAAGSSIMNAEVAVAKGYIL